MAHPAAVLHQPVVAAEDGRGASPERPHRDQRVGGHRDGGGRPMSAVETQEYAPVFTGKTLERLQEILTRYPTKQAALLPALWLVQGERGWISDRSEEHTSELQSQSNIVCRLLLEKKKNRC